MTNTVGNMAAGRQTWPLGIAESSHPYPKVEGRELSAFSLPQNPEDAGSNTSKGMRQEQAS